LPWPHGRDWAPPFGRVCSCRAPAKGRSLPKEGRKYGLAWVEEVNEEEGTLPKPAQWKNQRLAKWLSARQMYVIKGSFV
jgi:hypothetical protein